VTAQATAEEEARWAAAAELAKGSPDERVSVRRTRTLLWIAALLLGSVLSGAVLALVLVAPDGGDSAGSGFAERRLVPQFVLLALGCLVGITGFVWARRTGHYITRWRQIQSPLTRREQKDVRRQIAGKVRADQDRLPIVLAIARQSRRASLGVVPVYVALIFFSLSSAVSSRPVILVYLQLTAVALFLGVLVQLVVAYRRAGIFIETHRPITLGPFRSRGES
jgi:hypothetical protein